MYFKRKIHSMPSKIFKMFCQLSGNLLNDSNDLRFLISVITSVGTEQLSYATASSTLSNICPALFLHMPDSLSNTRCRHMSDTHVICPTVSSTHYSMSNVCTTHCVSNTLSNAHFRQHPRCMPSTCSKDTLRVCLTLSQLLATDAHRPFR